VRVTKPIEMFRDKPITLTFAARPRLRVGLASSKEQNRIRITGGQHDLIRKMSLANPRWGVVERDDTIR